MFLIWFKSTSSSEIKLIHKRQCRFCCPIWQQQNAW